MTHKPYMTVYNPKIYPQTKFGIPISKALGTFYRTQARGLGPGHSDHGIVCDTPRTKCTHTPNLGFLPQMISENARLAEHFIFFSNELNKFNNTRARMLDSIYHVPFRLLRKLDSAAKTL